MSKWVPKPELGNQGLGGAWEADVGWSLGARCGLGVWNRESWTSRPKFGLDWIEVGADWTGYWSNGKDFVVWLRSRLDESASPSSTDSVAARAPRSVDSADYGRNVLKR